MDKKKENIKTLFYIICASLALFLVISSLSSFFFYINACLHFLQYIRQNILYYYRQYIIKKAAYKDNSLPTAFISTVTLLIIAN